MARPKDLEILQLWFSGLSTQMIADHYKVSRGMIVKRIQILSDPAGTRQKDRDYYEKNKQRLKERRLLK